MEVVAEPSGNGVPAATSGPLARASTPDDPRAAGPDATGPTGEAGGGAPEGIVVSWPPLPPVADGPADAGDQRFDWPWAGRPGDSPIGDLLMDRLRANRAAVEREGARRARHGSPDEAPPAAADSVPVAGASPVTAGPAPKRPGPETGAGPTKGAAGHPDGRPPGTEAPGPEPLAQTARPAPPRPSDNPWTTGSWDSRRIRSRPTPARNGELPAGGPAPAGESPGEATRNLTGSDSGMPTGAAQQSVAGAGMAAVGVEDAGRAAPHTETGDRTRGDVASSGLAPSGSGRAGAPVAEAGSGDGARGGAAGRDVASGVPDGGVVPPESAPAELSHMSYAGFGDRALGGATIRDFGRGEVVAPEPAPAELSRVSDAGSGDRAPDGATVRDVARGEVVAPESASAQLGPAGPTIPGITPDDSALDAATVPALTGLDRTGSR